MASDGDDTVSDDSIWDAETLRYLAIIIVATLLAPGIILGWLIWWPLRRFSRIHWAVFGVTFAAGAYLLEWQHRLVFAIRDVGLLTVHLIQGLLHSLGVINLPFDIEVNFVNPAIGATVVAVATACTLGIIRPAKLNIDAKISAARATAESKESESLKTVYTPAAQTEPAADVKETRSAARRKIERTPAGNYQGELFNLDSPPAVTGAPDSPSDGPTFG